MMKWIASVEGAAAGLGAAVAEMPGWLVLIALFVPALAHILPGLTSVLLEHLRDRLYLTLSEEDRRALQRRNRSEHPPP